MIGRSFGILAVPFFRWRKKRQGNHDVEALSACGLHEALQVQLVEQESKSLGAFDNQLPRNIGARIKIENHHVRMLQVPYATTPLMNLEHVPLREGDQAP